MATKQAEINFEDMSLDELEQWKKQREEEDLKFKQAQSKKIADSKKEAFDELGKVVDKYRLNVSDILNSLLNARKIDFGDIAKVKPIYLIKAKVNKQKRNAPEGEMEESEFLFFEGKTILADKKQAEQVCSNGVDEFKKVLTDAGKQYLESEETKHIILDFYNEHKPAKANEWK
ncbi:hypothetical protein [Ralstonia pickettii]|jgi:hypothetical protein|uniref:hypothetical protein n=1 Tax=Ralstonia pickettii TaxID=329 RepID=UPI00260E8E79|nr:hypothetical protein [Ralstonia pickettii]